MFRVALLRASALPALRQAAALRATGPAMRFVRLESTDAKDPRRQLLEARDDLQRDWDAKELSYEELKPKTLQPSPATYLIDVREPDEVLQGSIPSSVNIPLTVLADSLHVSRAKFKEQFGFEKPKHDQEVVFYCRSGKRSTTACDVAKRNGYKK
ncbi:hypothetical protein PHLCEN_2v12805 [Hermanssonia centrifuga]|uniref:Rhodanese domain-containing protein n=1 Tax=Hermanssonia centrifuga TaxID=98765 RepID=A0A2R6NG34_9APHY|nr:hypothetical protein PHLCEN_2v12805 [Hermanssonia centrifuga]